MAQSYEKAGVNLEAGYEVVHEIRDDFIRLFTESTEVTEKYRTGRSARRRLGQSIMRLFAGLL